MTEQAGEHVSGSFDRRAFLKGAMAGATVMALGSLAGAAAPRSEESLLLDVIDDFPGYHPPYESPLSVYEALDFETATDRLARYSYTDRSNLAIGNNPRLSQPIKNPGYAYAVTHPGFAETSISEARHLLSRPDSKEFRQWIDVDRGFYRRLAGLVQGEHGDYTAHRDRLIEMYDAFKHTDVPVLCFYETRTLDDPTSLRPEFALPKHAFGVGTAFADGKLWDVSNVRDSQSSTGFTEEPQRADLLFANLRKSGVREIRVAGEYSFDPWDTDPACLGVTSSMLHDQGFRVRGISGAVFPPEPPANPDDPRLARDLFDRAISFEQAIADL